VGFKGASMGVMTEEAIIGALEVIDTASLHDIYITLIQEYSREGANDLIEDFETLVRWYRNKKYMTKDD
jgi:hypothetical protein